VVRLREREKVKTMGQELALPKSDWHMHGCLSHVDKPMMSEERQPPRKVGFLSPYSLF